MIIDKSEFPSVEIHQNKTRFRFWFARRFLRWFYDKASEGEDARNALWNHGVSVLPHGDKFRVECIEHGSPDYGKVQSFEFSKHAYGFAVRYLKTGIWSKDESDSKSPGSTH